MIVQLTGEIVYKEPTYLVLNVGGIGYGVHISLYTFTQIKAVALCTLQTVWHVKSDAHILYGFYTLEEKEWWLRLISVSSIGPKTALTILSSLTPSELHKIILDKEEKSLTAIKGIGLKAAQRLILELTDQAQKLDYVAGTTVTLPQQAEMKTDRDAITALVMLGLTQKAAEKAVLTVRSAQDITPLTLEELIKSALQAT
ncbi:MAG: Holliday junction branch migration protein RuvA [Candidatus Cardinium sp.]|nr:Holliday junction branch migration protein RuvA [Candidatus Cardinium sp.]